MALQAVNKSGFTLVELLLTIALMAILGVGAASVSVTYLMSVNINTTVSNVETAIETARGYTLDHYKGNANYGIVVFPSKLLVYAGTSYTGANTIFYTVSVPVGIQFTAINFNNANYYYYASISALPSNSGGFKINSPFLIKTIQVNTLGIVNAL